jgi:hypothetical protein
MPGSIIAAAVFETAVANFTWYMTATAFAINMVASTIIAKAFAPSMPGGSVDQTPNPGNTAQLPPNGSNKVPVIYGTAYTGGIITDLSITSDNQKLYYVLTLAEVTSTNAGQTPDTYTFGNIYWGGKRCVFDSTDQYKVVGLLDESTGVTDNTVAGKLNIYLFRNGSSSGVNTSQTAIQIMNSSGLVYTWDSNKAMTNVAFAIVELTYSVSANLTGIQQTRFQLTNSRYKPGDCIYDYLINDRYGAAITATNIDTTSLTALNTYSNGNMTYTTYSGGTSTLTRFRFDGIVPTDQTIMSNLQVMSACCDCLIRYNEITGKWGVVVQSPTYTVSMDINDSNMVSAIQVTPIDLSNTFNVAEVKFTDGTQKDSFSSATFDLADVNPSLLYPNEPVNKQTINLNLVNNDVRAQYLANRFLESVREDLQIKVDINYSGIQLEAGDIVTVTNSNYGWVAKLFRVSQIVEKFGDDGSVTASLTLMEFNPSVYDDVNVTQFTPAPNTGIGSPLGFGTIPAPVVVGQQPSVPVPYISLQVTAPPYGIVQYAEIYYSAYSNPSNSQRIFAGTTSINPGGNPYTPGAVMEVVNLSNIPKGDWYFSVKMVNAIGSSIFSASSSVFQWRPTTIQFASRYISVAYATSITGSGFSLSPRGGKTYFGIYNSNIQSPSTNPSDYTWYLSPIAFSTDQYFLWVNYGNNLIAYSVGEANYAAGSGSFVPSDTTTYDPSIWLALPDGFNVIDLNSRTGQLIQTGTTTVGTGEIAITNNPQGQIVASLAQLLDFGPGVYTKTGSAANITIDIYGRVVGFTTPDAFYYTMTAYTASSGQTVFSVTRGSGYIVGQCFVFRNGLFLDPSNYTDAATTVTLANGATAGDIVTIISFRSYNSSTGFYASFTQNSTTLTNQSSYTASGFTLVNGYELLFLNGTVVNSQDYNIFGQTITFVQAVSGDLQIVQWANNNLGVPNGTPVNTDIYTIIGQALYTFSFDPNAFNLYNNGCLLLETVDYSVSTGSYTLAQTPTSNLNLLVQQTFQRTGAA